MPFCSYRGGSAPKEPVPRKPMPRRWRFPSFPIWRRSVRGSSLPRDDGQRKPEGERPVVRCLVGLPADAGYVQRIVLVSLEAAAVLRDSGWYVVGPDP